jgi:hypothetical protein
MIPDVRGCSDAKSRPPSTGTNLVSKQTFLISTKAEVDDCTMRKNNQRQSGGPVIRPLHLMLGFFGSFIIVMTFTSIYGSNLVVLKSTKTLDERLLIGITFPKTADWWGATPDNSATNRQNGPAKSSATYASNTTLVPETINQCGNSDRWLNSRRYGNLNDDALFTADLAKSILLNLDTMLIPDSSNNQNNHVLSTLLDRSICHANSRFLNSTIPPLSSSTATSSSSNNEDPRSVRLWAFKLIYLAMHYHQHRLAVPEAKARMEPQESRSCANADELWSQHGVGVFDYECPDAKYLVMPLGGTGLGSNIRGGTVLAYLTGLSTYSKY